ncbi:MAG: erythromycin esterase family protein [Bacteroidota bacterium]
MDKSTIFLLLSLIPVFFSCKEDELALDPETVSLVQTLEEDLVPLTQDPLNWSNEALQFLDPIANKSIIALGEATHGTAEFFEAKHRIFQYLVENHDYKVFAFEADFGESLFINEAVQTGDKSKIESLMKDKMHFWTWKTEEVKALLEWMCDYNIGKADEDKVQYVGIDCQYNTFHPTMLKDYLQVTNTSLYSEVINILDEAQSATGNRFQGYTDETFNDLKAQLVTLQDSLAIYKDKLINNSSEKAYLLNTRILRVIIQVIEVNYYRNFSTNNRDLYMAENTVWYQEYYNGKKIVLWAHNAHIANNEYFGTGSIGYHISKDKVDEYITVAFLFSKGSFTAVGRSGDDFTGLGNHIINDEPLANSINNIFANVNQSVFTTKVENLQKHNEWQKAFSNNLRYLQIGAVFNNQPHDYYSTFRPSLFDYIIYFDNTTASKLL